MKYISTRGQTPAQNFQDAVLTGLAPDGGLLLPQSIPDVSAQLAGWRGLSFVALAKEVVALFVDDIPRPTLDTLVDEAYASFDIQETVAFTQLGDTQVLELFHGPTLAFKDVALQLLGKLFEYILAERGTRLNIVGATSGDTGSAAIAGVRGQSNIDIFIMFPTGRVSPLQELQMTSIADENVHCLSVNGSFDDCQNLMKTLFADLEFKQQYQLGAVNSVNWARVLAQVVYYAYASLHFASPVAFCVPTGNFGNIFAGYLAKRMGFPISRLLLATNENDILARFFNSGEYSRGTVAYTNSPAMDIQVASNFERFLYYHLGEDSEALRQFMADFAAKGIAQAAQPSANQGFAAIAISEAETLATIRSVKERYNYVADPHTAVGLAAAEKLGGAASGEQLVCIATAHPAKFPEAVSQALGGESVTHPRLEALRGLPARSHPLEPDLAVLKQYVQDHGSGG